MIHASLQAVADPAHRSADHQPLGGAEPRGGLAPSLEELRADALWRTAPLFAGLSAVCAALVAWTMLGTRPPLMIAAWLTAVLLRDFGSLRVERLAVSYPLVQTGRSQLWRIGETGAHALLWASLPATAFVAQPAPGQLLIAAAFGTMIAGAFLLALAPAAACLWAALLAAALLWGAGAAAGGDIVLLVLLLSAYLAVILVGCLTVERLLTRHMDMAARERVRRDAITLLLKEYEDQGAGWLWQVDAFCLFTYASPRIAGLIGRAPAQMLGLPIAAVLGGNMRLNAALAARESFANIEVQVTAPDGKRWISLSGSPIVGPGGSFHGFRGVGADITETHRSQERLTRMASNDMLTGLPNRLRMREILAAATAAAARDGQPVAVMFLDLDGFKPVNDRFGHPIGDAVLRGVAQRLSAVVGDRGQVGRVGGDEFALVLETGGTPAAAEAMAQELIAAVTAPFIFDKGEVRIGLSVGCAFAPADGTDVEELLLKADLALYEAKSRGRGTFRAFRPEMQQAAERRDGLEHDLRQALRLRQLSLHYQPVLSAGACEISGFEALLRWHHPERGPIPPAAFLPIAEQTGIIGDIGAWVLRTACRDAAAWPAPLFVSVNVSPRQLATPGFADAIGDALSASGLAPGRLQLEVPEQVFLRGADAAIDVLERIRRRGVTLALDNFGVGHAALGHVATNLFDTLKLDGRFLRDALSAEDTATIVHAVVAVAKSFRMHVVAERIETDEELLRVEEIGCSRFQGFLASAPMPFAATQMLLRPPAPAEAGPALDPS